ncbi:DUF6660 family protein [Dyadobacter sp. CY323]|uniref:DUF6660 family protein n=1 Tax=Dyadobacter sp. CY323 TaxID=2907302 RepID=UPI001F469D47|nr:DUF6660 family protein [Dyadobacter sp. CY323]MCE6991052.1 hypothetical protein [Dyadobacter sp. CY323]
MKRFVLVLLAFYSIALSCIPCQDQEEAAPENQIVVIKPDTDQQGHFEMDLCSPFCTCACCASVSLQHQIAFLPLKASFTTFKEISFAYLSATNRDDLTSIWQPPRV